MQFVINGVALKNGGKLSFDGVWMSNFFSRYFNTVTQTTVQEELWSSTPDFAAQWGGGTSHARTYSGTVQYYYSLNTSGNLARCQAYNNSAWSYGAWATAQTNGTFNSVNSTATGHQVSHIYFGAVAGAPNRLIPRVNNSTANSGAIDFTISGGFTGSAYSQYYWEYNGANYLTTYLQTSGGLIRTAHSLTGFTTGYGAWLSLT